jgi:Flp pilus assembly protein TadG
MRSVNNEKGSVLVFMTLMIVLLMVMVGMGLDTGQLTYTRSQGQAAVDAAALSAVSGLPLGVTADAEVKARAAAFDSKNDYLNSPNNQIAASNITYVQYDPTNTTNPITTTGVNVNNANGVRVALETTNPYTTVAAGTAMKSPVFLTPLMKLFGQSAPGTADVSVSAVAVTTAKPSIPIAIHSSVCNGSTTVPDVQIVTSPAGPDNSCWTTYWDPPVNTPKVQDLFTSTKTCSGLPNGGSGPISLSNGVNTPVYPSAESLFNLDWTVCWMVPVVAGTGCTGAEPIVDWAKICPSKVYYPGGGGGSTKCPDGKNNKCIIASVTCGQSLYRTDDSLCFASRLVREPQSGM